MTKNMARHNQQQLDTSPSLSPQGADVITSPLCSGPVPSGPIPPREQGARAEVEMREKC